MERYVLDTDLLVEFLRGRSTAVSTVARLRESGTLATTVINAFELYWGAYKLSYEKAKDVNRLLARLEVLSIDKKIAEKAGEEMAHLEKIGLPIGVRDLLIGVIAREHGYTVVTGNEEHFQRIRGLRVLNRRKERP